ncbi:MAG TPA: glycosyltransferase [Solirubrobacteraceae bacterium]|nr:glycosyltransferase [Solirubrobacteraceae bacterium]
MERVAISVVVPSHGRPQRLRALLDALATQTLPRARWEAVVVHDCGPGLTAELLRTHPLAATGVLRHRSLPPGTGSAARMRNVGWSTARAPLVAFTDDDCRPRPDWLERLLAAAARHPGAIVQGRTRPDPDEAGLFAGPGRATTKDVEPPTPFGQTCNILYPRVLLERLGGFYEGFELPFGEDMDLLLRAQRAGAALLAAPVAVVDHAVTPQSLGDRLRWSARLEQMPLVARRNPEARTCTGQPFRAFLVSQHAWLLLAAAGLALAPRRPAAALLAMPWVRHVRGRPRHRAIHGWPWLRALAEAALTDTVDLARLARGSARHRALWL